jgi:hypothetical protein
MAVNIFRNIKANLTTSGSSLYTAPLGYSGIVLMAQISNITNNTISANMSVISGSTVTSLITNFQIPGQDAAGALTGKLVLQPGEQVFASASANSVAQVVLSVLESQN